MKKTVPKIEACFTENFQSLCAVVPAWHVKDSCWFSRGCYAGMNTAQGNPSQSLPYEQHKEQIYLGKKKILHSLNYNRYILRSNLI